MNKDRVFDALGDLKFQTKTKTLLLEPHFSVAKANPEGRTDPEPPLRIFNKFSRWIITIIDTTDGDHKAVSHNLSMNRHRYEYDHLAAAIQDGISLELPYLYGVKVSSESLETGPAYTTKLHLFPYKGKTPAEVLLSEGNTGREKLIDMYNNKLSPNVNQYPGNQAQMDAIQAAVILYDKNELKKENVTAQRITLYESQSKPNPYKKDRNTDGNTNNGKDLSNVAVTELNLYLYHGDRSPFELEIQNYNAPCKETETGAFNVTKSEKTNFVSHSFRLTAADMRAMLREMERQVNGFYYAHYLECERDAYNEDLRRRLESRNQTQKSQPYVAAPSGAVSQPPYGYYGESVPNNIGYVENYAGPYSYQTSAS